MAFSLALIIVLGLTADYLFRRLRLPGLVGMLVVGIIVGPYVLNFMKPQMMEVSADFRMIALIVILLRAGFELQRDTLNRVGRAALTMSAVPAVFEIAGVVLVAPPLLHITYLEAAILGASCVSCRRCAAYDRFHGSWKRDEERDSNPAPWSFIRGRRLRDSVIHHFLGDVWRRRNQCSCQSR